MKYVFEDLSPKQFEDLLVCVCQKLFGISVQGFAQGPDGGRDAKFEGTAELHPSKASPWVGKTIIQAKHTNGYNKRFSDPDFFSDRADAILQIESKRVKTLKKQGELDHYFICSNRRLGGNTESKIKNFISKECGIPTSSIYICDTEQLDRLLRLFPAAAENAQISPNDSPLIVSSQELGDIIESLSAFIDSSTNSYGRHPTNRTPYDRKNEINGLTVDYAKAQRRYYLKDSRQIQDFLASPQNESLSRMYNSVVQDFQLKILANRSKFETFDQVLEAIFEMLVNRDSMLRSNKRLTRAVLFFMYWTCDIGKDESDDNASANETLAS